MWGDVTWESKEDTHAYWCGVRWVRRRRSKVRVRKLVFDDMIAPSLSSGDNAVNMRRKRDLAKETDLGSLEDTARNRWRMRGAREMARGLGAAS